MMVKTCDYFDSPLTKKDVPYEVKSGIMRYGNVSKKIIYDLCLPCRKFVAGFKKSTVTDLIKSKHQDCCTALGDICKCCNDKHECLRNIPPIILE